LAFGAEIACLWCHKIIYICAVLFDIPIREAEMQ